MLRFCFLFCSVDSRSDIPCPVGSGKKRLELFPKPKQSRAKRMKKMPDLSALVGDELGTSGDNPMAILDGMSYEVPTTVPILASAVPQDLAECEGDDADGDGAALVRRRRKRSEDDLPSEGNGNDDQGVPSYIISERRRGLPRDNKGPQLWKSWSREMLPRKKLRTLSKRLGTHQGRPQTMLQRTGMNFLTIFPPPKTSGLRRKRGRERATRTPFSL